MYGKSPKQPPRLQVWADDKNTDVKNLQIRVINSSIKAVLTDIWNYKSQLDITDAQTNG